MVVLRSLGLGERSDLVVFVRKVFAKSKTSSSTSCACLWDLFFGLMCNAEFAFLYFLNVHNELSIYHGDQVVEEPLPKSPTSEVVDITSALRVPIVVVLRWFVSTSWMTLCRFAVCVIFIFLNRWASRWEKLLKRILKGHPGDISIKPWSAGVHLRLGRSILV